MNDVEANEFSCERPSQSRAVGQNGQLFAEQTTTLEVNRDGARIGLKNPVRLGDEVRVTNLATGFTALFRVSVQCPQSYGGLPEWGIAVSPSIAGLITDFWGVLFEDLTRASEPHISALLACRVCGRQELVALSRSEYDVLLQDLVLPHICPVCRTATDWEPAEPTGSKAASGMPSAARRAAEAPSPETPSAASEARPAGAGPAPHEAGAEPAPPIVPPTSTRPPEEVGPEAGLPLASSRVKEEGKAVAVEARGEESVSQAAPGEANRRIARRVSVGVPILVRTSDGRTEETVTRDVSRTGLSFPTLLDLGRGDSIEIVVGHGVVPNPAIQQAEVVWRRPDQKGVKGLAGARFTVVREREAPGRPAVATRPEKGR